MKKVLLKISRHTKNIVLGLATVGTLAFAQSSKQANGATLPVMATFSLVAVMKKNGSYDKLDEGSKTFVDGLDVALKELATDTIDKSTLDSRLKAFETEVGKKTVAMTEEEKKGYDSAVENVRKLANEIQKLKDQGFVAEEVLPFDRAFIKAVNENKEALAALKGEAKKEVNMSFKAAAIMGTGNVTNTSAPTLPGTTVMQGLNAAPRDQPFLLDLVDVGSVSTPTIMWYNKINRENGSAFIAEGQLKPLSDFDIVGETASVKKVATRFNVNEEMLTDIPFIESEIRSEGVENLRIKIDEQLLAGDGAGSNLKGIIEYAGGYALPAIDDSVVSSNEYDVILAVNTMLDTLNYNASAVIVHPTTRFKLRTMKDKNGNYIIPPSADKNALNIDGLPVISKNQITPGKLLMGDMKKSHVRMLMDINVRVGYNGEDFAYNRVTFLVEARLTHFIKDVETSAFIYDDFDTIKAALEAPSL